MKTNRTHTPAAGFTLIEMLVVITIIGVLAGIAFPVFSAVTERARKTQVKAMVKDLLVAIKGFQTEYGRYPSVGSGGGADDTTVLTDSGNQLISGLLGQNDGVNPKGIPFFESKLATNGRAGLISGGDSAFSLVDAWGTPFTVIMDTNYDNKVDNPNPSSDSAVLPMGVAVFSNGADQLVETWDNSRGKGENISSW